jgi:hypothetical protein
MRFREGMRRAAIAFWWVSATITFLMLAGIGSWTPSAVGYAVGVTLAYGGIYWLAVYIIRWIWMGFVGPEQAE